MHGWGAWGQKLRLAHVTSQLYSSKVTSTKQHGHAAAGLQQVKLAEWRQHGSVTWDIALSRPIQHCEEHNRQGWPFTHRLPLCRTNWPHIIMQSNRTNTMGSTEIWREIGGLSFTALVFFHLHTLLQFLWISVQCLLKKHHYLKE